MHYIETCTIKYAWVTWDKQGTPSISEPEVREQRCFRAARLLDKSEADSERILFLYFPMRSIPHLLTAFLKQVREHGVTASGSHYTFLGITEPSIKEGYIILLEEGGGITVTGLLSQLGDLESVYVKSGPGKYAARLGLSFSSTIETFEVQPAGMSPIPDEEAHDGTRVTDGCALIRASVAEDIFPMLYAPQKPSVLQVRIGGIKGLLVVYPDDLFDILCSRNANAKARISSKVILVYRESMFKYHGGPRCIEINKYSQSSTPARMNAAFVILLLTLDKKLLMPLQSLLRLQVNDIEKISIDRGKAIEEFEKSLPLREKAGSGPGSYYSEIYDMLKAGHSLEEPCLLSMLHRYQKDQFRALREKLNFIVPESRYIYGICDEFGALNDEEVYINISGVGVIDGNVLVTRNPCYLPSDVRVLNAVKSKTKTRAFAKANLRDCIVFPKDCKTSIPNLMGGGDLDGDMYFVCWDRTIVPSKSCIKQPDSQVDNPPPSAPMPCERDIINLQKDLLDLFRSLYQNRFLGSVSKTWQSVVERDPKLADGLYPKALARIVAVALDMTKSNADFQKLVSHFEDMEEKYRKEVKKNKDRLSPVDELRNIIPIIPDPDRARSMPYDRDEDLIVRAWDPEKFDDFYEQGKELMRRFNMRMKQLLAEREEDEDIKFKFKRPTKVNKAEELRIEYRKRYFSHEITDDPKDLSLYIRASAWYCVGYEKGKVAFAWLGAKYLNEIKARRVYMAFDGIKYASSAKCIDGFSNDTSLMDLEERRGREEIRKLQYRSTSRSGSRFRTQGGRSAHVPSKKYRVVEYMIVLSMMVLGLVVAITFGD